MFSDININCTWYNICSTWLLDIRISTYFINYQVFATLCNYFLFSFLHYNSYIKVKQKVANIQITKL